RGRHGREPRHADQALGFARLGQAHPGGRERVGRGGPAVDRPRQRALAEDGVKESAGVALVRVDNRLVHGQVLEAWLPALGAHGILVADDEAAGNVLARSAMALAIPPKVSFQVLRVEAAADLLKTGPLAQRTLVLLRDVRDA